jgi:hypothetical protein
MPPEPYPALRGIMGRGIAGVKIFGNKKDREDFLERLADLVSNDALRARQKITWHFRIPSSGHLCPILPALGGTKSSK